MRYRVLGEVALLPDQGPPHPLRRRRERTVLAVLLAAHGRPVTAERLLADVWGESSGAGLGSLQVAVSRLRADLEPDRSPRDAPRLLVSTGGGYALVAGTADVDAWQFEALATRALGADDPAAALRLGEQATRWWAGAPYADCDTELLARERDRLEELRASLLERRAEDLLALGRDREALTVAADGSAHDPPMAQFVLHHRHDPEQCGVAFAAFKGHDSPLRHRPTLASCRSGGHQIWWTVHAATEQDALDLLPYYVAERTTASQVSQVEIP